MRRKPTIAKRDGKWTVRRPAFGFRPDADETKHDTFRDAVRSMTQAAEHYAAGSSTERADLIADPVASLPRWSPLEY